MIEINNQTKYRVNQKTLTKKLQHSLRLLKKKLDLSVAIVSSQEIKKLNRIYRRLNQPTDVLSFEGLNEIIICFEEARKNAKFAGWSTEKELINLLIHGLLHLLGYNHRTSKQVKKMNQLANKLLIKINELE